MRHLYGEVFCEALERLQRDAIDKPRPELVVKVDRSGLNEHHPIVARLYEAIDRVLSPIVAAEERRAGAHLIGAPRAVTARDQVGLRALNDLLKAAFDQPGNAAAEPGQHPADQSPAQPSERPGQHRSCPRPHPRASRRPPRRRPRLGRCGSNSRRCGFTRARSAPSRCSPTPSSSRRGLAWRSRPTPA